jgi:hypothetical protein
MMRARMQLEPHPSQFLSLRERARKVNAGRERCAVRIEGKQLKPAS